MDQVVFTVLTTFVLLGKFGDFLLSQAGAGGKKTASDEPAPPPASETPGAEAPASTAAATKPVSPPRSTVFTRSLLFAVLEFFEDLFGKKALSAMRVYRLFLLSAFYVQGSFLFSSFITPRFWSGVQPGAWPFIEIALAVLVLVLANLVADLLSVFFCMKALEKLNESIFTAGDSAGDRTLRYLKFTFIVILSFVFYYGLFITTVNVYFSLIVHLQGIAAGYDELVGSVGWALHAHVFETETLVRFLDPVTEGRYIGINGVNILVFCVTPLFAPGLVLFVALVGGLLEAADGATNGFVTAKLEGEFSTKPFFLKAATLLALLGGAASSLQGAFDG